LGGREAGQGRVRAQVVVVEHKNANHGVGTRVTVEAVFGFVPSLEGFVETFNQVVGNPIVEVLDADMLATSQVRFNRYTVSGQTIGNNTLGLSEFADAAHNGVRGDGGTVTQEES